MGGGGRILRKYEHRDGGKFTGGKVAVHSITETVENYREDERRETNCKSCI